MARHVSRREFISIVAGGVGITSVLAACGNSQAIEVPTRGPSGTPPATAATAASTQPAAAQPTAAVQPPTQATATVAAVPQPAVAQRARNETLIMSVSDTINQMSDVDVVNPFLQATKRTGWHFGYEPLYFYNPWWTKEVSGPSWTSAKDGEIPYLATSYTYNTENTELTLKLRPQVTWSDGQPFTSRDVIFTLTMLKQNAPKLLWASDMKLWIKEVTAPDDFTVKITLNSPNPRFMFQYLMWHQDAGFPIVAEHSFKDQDPLTFKNFDVTKGLPVVTGPWKLVHSDPQQKIWDRRDDWWGAKGGFRRLPAMQRVIVLPLFEGSKLTQLLISNEVDSTHNLSPADSEVAVSKNTKLILRAPDKSRPWGWLDWWTNAINFNDSKPPFDDPDIRWALSFAIDRKQIVDLGFKGDTQATTLPFPAYTPLLPYFDSVKDLLEKYPIGTFDLAKSEQRMQAKGYAKDSEGMWSKDGKRLAMVITLPPGFFENFVPIIVAQLRKAGFDAAFKAPTNYSSLEQEGNVDAFLDGHAGSVRDPYENLSHFESRYAAKTGEAAERPYRWRDPDFDKLVDQMGNLATSDAQFAVAYHAAMERWIAALPSIPTVQWYLIMPINTTYWKGWPDATTLYCAPSMWHRGSAGLVLNTLEPA
jgi:peptide/nickel transport system substrate-binding protein